MQSETSTPPAQPAPPPPPSCANCGAPLHGKFCHDCGQPVHGLVRHFSSLMGDIADSLFNLDARVFRTIGPLYLRPGRLTLDYFEGKRTRYVTPFRLVFFLAIIAFFAIQLTVRSGYTPILRVQPSATARAPVSPAPPATVKEAGAFSNGDIRLDDRVWWNRDTKPLRVVWLPGFLNDWLNDLAGNAQEQLHAMNSGSEEARREAQHKFNLRLFAVAPTVLFVLLPIFALLLKFFYIFKKRLYMEHVIVAMHSQAFLMLSMLVLVALYLLRGWLAPHAAWLATVSGLLIAAAWIWMFVYLFLMQKRVYRQGWFMTTVKYWMIGWCYTVLVGFGMVFAVLLSLTGA